LPEVRRRIQGDSQYRGSGSHRQDFAAFACQGCLAAANRIAASCSGLTHFGLVCIASGIHTSLRGKQQQEMLPEIRLKAKKAVGKGGFRRKPGELSGLRSGRWGSQACSVTIFCLDRQGVLRLFSLYLTCCLKVESEGSIGYLCFSVNMP
jgi:hypothetical protein